MRFNGQTFSMMEHQKKNVNKEPEDKTSELLDKLRGIKLKTDIYDSGFLGVRGKKQVT